MHCTAHALHIHLQCTAYSLWYACNVQNFVDVVTDVITVNIVTFCMVSLGMALLTLYRFGGRLRRKLRRRPTSPYLDSGAAGGTLVLGA